MEYCLDNIVFPTNQDFIFTESAMMIGFTMALEFISEGHTPEPINERLPGA